MRLRCPHSAVGRARRLGSNDVDEVIGAFPHVMWLTSGHCRLLQVDQVRELVRSETSMLESKSMYEAGARYLQVVRAMQSVAATTLVIPGLRIQENPDVLCAKVVAHFQQLFGVRNMEGKRR